MAVLNQRDAWEFTRIAGPGACVTETDNAKRPRIGLGGQAYKGRVTAFEPGCNTLGSGWGGHHFVPNLLFLFEGTYEI